MRISVPTEVKNNEFRVALTPAGVHDLVLAGHEVVVQSGAGAGSSMSDSDYLDAGATLLDDADEVSGAIPSSPVPEHHNVFDAQEALMGEGALALFNSGDFGAFTRTYYPSDVIAAINTLWTSHADVLAPRTKMSLIASATESQELCWPRLRQGPERTTDVYQGVRRPLADVDVLVMPTALTTAPKTETPAGELLEALDDNLSRAWTPTAANTAPFNFTGHPALATPVGKAGVCLPACSSSVAFSTTRCYSRSATRTSTWWTGTRRSVSRDSACRNRPGSFDVPCTGTRKLPVNTKMPGREQNVSVGKHGSDHRCTDHRRARHRSGSFAGVLR